MKSQTSLRTLAQVDLARRPMSSLLPGRPEKHSGGTSGGMVKIAARNTFRGRESEIVDWDRECEIQPEMEMPSPFIRRRGTRISGRLQSQEIERM